MRIAEAQLVRAAGELAKEGKIGGADLIRSVTSFLKRKRLTRRIGKIERALDQYIEQESNTVKATVITARTLSEAERTTVALEAATLLGKQEKKITLDFREDPSLIGGIRIETADTRYDRSVSRALRELHKSL